MYQTKEEMQKKAAAKVASYRNIAALYPTLAKAIKKWDKKCYNKRFAEDIREETAARIFTDKNASGYLFVYLYDDFNQQRTIATLKPEQWINEKRLDAAALLESARSYRERYLKDAYALEQFAPQAETIRSYIEELQARIKSIKGSIPYETREIFALDSRY